MSSNVFKVIVRVFQFRKQTLAGIETCLGIEAWQNRDRFAQDIHLFSSLRLREDEELPSCQLTSQTLTWGYFKTLSTFELVSTHRSFKFVIQAIEMIFKFELMPTTKRLHSENLYYSAR